MKAIKQVYHMKLTPEKQVYHIGGMHMHGKMHGKMQGKMHGNMGKKCDMKAKGKSPYNVKDKVSVKL